MSDIDSFIDEVTDEVRRDRLFNAMRKYGWIAILAVVVLVGGVAFREWRMAQQQASARAFGDAVLAAQVARDPGAQARALEAIKAQGAQASVTDFLAAGAAGKAGDVAGAVKRLDAIAGNTALPPAYRDLAQLKKVLIPGASLGVDQRRQILGALSQPGRPYRPLALEQLALMAVTAGDTKGAIDQFNVILNDSDTAGTPGLRRRATQMIVALGGTPKAG